MDVNKPNQSTSISTGGGPEHEPATTASEAIHRVVEHAPSEEVGRNIDYRPETVTLPKELEKAGVESTAHPIFASIDPEHLPLTDSEIIKAKKLSPSRSIRWLAENCLKVLKKTHQTLKLIHGKVVRIKTS